MTSIVQTGFHLRFGNRKLINSLKNIMKTVLKPAGVTIIILEIDKNFVFESHPELKVGENALTREDAEDLQSFARSIEIEIVPLFQCLGHQGWGGSRSELLTAYPEFDETPNVPLDAQWPEIFCRSWCPKHPEINKVVYDLLGDMIDAFSPDYVHIGMDEVYEIASDQCSRCKGEDRAELFAKAVNDMHSYIKQTRGIEVMMWGDRLLNAEAFGYDNWEGDTFGTYKAIDLIPKDIVVIDWHYDEREKGYPTPHFLMEQGFRVMPACWYKENVAEQLFTQTKQDAQTYKLAHLFFGKLVTSWHNWDEQAFTQFINFKTEDKKEETELYTLYCTLNHLQEY